MAKPQITFSSPVDGAKINDSVVTVVLQGQVDGLFPTGVMVYDLAYDTNGKPLRELVSYTTLPAGGQSLSIMYPVKHAGNGGKRYVTVVAWNKVIPPASIADVFKETHQIKAT